MKCLNLGCFIQLKAPQWAQTTDPAGEKFRQGHNLLISKDLCSVTIFSPSFGDLRPNRAAVDTMLLSACSSSTTGFLPAPVIIRYTRKSQSSTQKDRLPSAPPGCSWLLISSTILNYKEKGFAAEAMLFGIKKDSSFLLPPPPICFSCFIQNLLLWTLLDFLPF